MAAAKVHYVKSINDFGLPTSICGMSGGEQTKSVELVTCALCKRELQEQEIPMHAPHVLDLAAGERVGCRVALEIRREIADGVRWSNWTQPVREYFVARDEGAPLRSTSDPSRFQGMTPSGKGAEGDRAQRKAEELAVVSKELDAAFDGPFELSSIPQRRLSVETCKAIIELTTAGMYVASTGLRREMTTHEVADFVQGVCGFVVTVGNIRSVRMAGGRRIEDGFVRRGIVARRDPGLVEHDMAKIETEFDLTGWKAIAEAIDRSVSSAQRLAEDETDPLPVANYGKGTVVASTREVREWLVRYINRGRRTAAR